MRATRKGRIVPDDDREAMQARDELAQQLQPFGDHFGRGQREARGSHDAADTGLVLRGGRIDLGDPKPTSSGSKRFAIDSPLEGDGFELSVPGRETVKPSWETGLLSRKRERICWGTEGSNPSPSSGESSANLIFGGRIPSMTVRPSR